MALLLSLSCDAALGLFLWNAICNKNRDLFHAQKSLFCA